MDRKFLNLLLVFFGTYIILYIIFFVFFKVVSTDTVIAIGLSFLFYLIYFFSNKQITKYLILQSRNIYIFFYKLIYLVISVKKFILILNKGYLNFLGYKFYGLVLCNDQLNFIDKKFEYLKFFYINQINKIFLDKLISLSKFLKIINNSFIISDLNNLLLNLNNLNNNIFYYILK